MARKYSLSIHDLRVSAGQETADTLHWLLDTFNVPLSVHLVFDASLEKEPYLLNFIKGKIEERKIEIVFHGLTHRCSKNVSKALVFYHKYEAEYLDDSELLREETKTTFESQAKLLHSNMGICPPCWITIRKNRNFLQSLNPLFLESLLYINNLNKKYFSPVVSLGSPKKSELYFLKLLGRLMIFIASVIYNPKVRVAIHTCDIQIENSVIFFDGIIKKLNKKGFQPVLINQLVD